MYPSHLRLLACALLLALAAMKVPSASGAVSATLLKPPLVEDPRKAAIQQVVRSAYPGLFSDSAAPGWVSVTLLMNPDGSLYKGYKDETRPRPYITGTAKFFAAMGAGPADYGDRVQLDMRGGAAGATRLYVRAYLPRPAQGRMQPREVGPAAPNDDPAVNRAIAEKYFPDLHTYDTPAYQSVADFWVLLDRTGEVLATGRRYQLGQGDLKRYLESLYPGIRTDGFQPVELRGDHGRPAVVNFTWLAADSPVTDLSKAEGARRGDVAVYANISGDGTTAETTLAVLRFGASSVAVCDDKDLDLEVTATDGGNGFVMLRARIQHVARVPPARFEFGVPNAVESAWSVESQPVRVRYGEPAHLRLTDQEHRSWKVTLYPDRLRGATAIR